MGMAPYGDPERFDLGRLIRKKGKGFEVDTSYVNTVGLRRHKESGVGFYFSDKLIDWLGPRRKGEVADEPYVHYAASTSKPLPFFRISRHLRSSGRHRHVSLRAH